MPFIAFTDVVTVYLGDPEKAYTLLYTAGLMLTRISYCLGVLIGNKVGDEK